MSFNYGHSKNTSHLPDIDPVKLLNAIDAVDDGSGNIVCASGAAGCVPINLFGEGAFSSEAADYVTDIGEAISRNTLQIATANISGRLPFGVSEPVAFNLGYEHRKEEARFAPDLTQQAGVRLIGGANGARAVEGQFKTSEVYAETIVPLVSPSQNFGAVKSLSLEGAVRYVDNSVAGGATTWSAGGRFAPRLPGWGDGLLFRGVYMRAIRAPAVTELFSGITPIADGIGDPCDDLNIDQGSNPAVRRANCEQALAAVGAAPAGVFSQTTDLVSAFGTSSGNPDLDNERAKSWSAGFVYQPVEHPAFRMAVDWSNIRLKGGIQTLGIDSILAACYDSPNFPNESTCGSFHRLTADEAAAQPGPTRVTGDIANGFTSGYVNVAGINFAGAIAAAAYNLDLRGGSSGMLRFNTKLSFVNEFETIASAGSPPDDSVGEAGMPKYRGNFSLGYTLRRFDADLQALWRSATKADRLSTREDTAFNNYPSYTLYNGTVGYRFTDHVRAQLAVLNLFDRGLPAAARTNLTFGQFDPLGRRYFLTLYANF